MSKSASETIKAAKSANIARLRELLTEDVSLLDARDKDGSTPLHCAVWKGHEDVVRFLIEAGADVNAQNENDHWGTTPLHAAAHANQKGIAEMLIERGADINAVDREGRTPLFHTTFHKAKAVARILERCGAR